jgi:5-methylcytosine-specific restriction protein A
MPDSPLKICCRPGCRRLTRDRHCEAHAKQTGSSRNRSGDPFYNSTAWLKLRAAKLAADPLCQCEDCVATGAVVPASVVDHIKPRCDYPELELDYDNLRSMSEAHHNRHTARTRRR